MSLQIGIPLFGLAALIQATVLSQVRVFGGQPDLVVIIVLGWAIIDQGLEGVVWAFIGGLFLDLLSGAPAGLSSLALIPVAVIVGLTEAQVYRTNAILTLALTAGGALAYHIIYLILLQYLGGLPVPWITGLWYVTLPSVLFDVILILPVMSILSRWYRLLHPRQAML